MTLFFVQFTSYFCIYFREMLLFCEPICTQPGGQIHGSRVDHQRVWALLMVPMALVQWWICWCEKNIKTLNIMNLIYVIKLKLMPGPGSSGVHWSTQLPYFSLANWNYEEKKTYCQTSKMRRTWVGNKIIHHSDVVGASPVHYGNQPQGC